MTWRKQIAQLQTFCIPGLEDDPFVSREQVLHVPLADAIQDMLQRSDEPGISDAEFIRRRHYNAALSDVLQMIGSSYDDAETAPIIWPRVSDDTD